MSSTMKPPEDSHKKRAEQEKIKKVIATTDEGGGQGGSSLGVASEKIDLQNIFQLKEAFDTADADGSGKLDMDEFVEAFGSVLLKTMNHKQLEQLFMKIDANSDEGVEWDEFMNYILLENQSLSLMKEEHFDYVKSDIEDPGYSKPDWHDDMITQILRIKEDTILPGEKYARTAKFITVAKDGVLKIFNNKGKIQASIKCCPSDINSVAYIKKFNHLVVATHEKSLLFYDMAMAGSVLSEPIGKYSDLQSMITSLDAFERDGYKRQLVIAGDDAGNLIMFQLDKEYHICDEDLKCHRNDHIQFRFAEIETKKQETIKRVKEENEKHEKSIDGSNKDKLWLWREMEKKEFYMLPTHHVKQNVDIFKLQTHSKSICQVQYIQDLNAIISCSQDTNIMIVNIDFLMTLIKEGKIKSILNFQTMKSLEQYHAKDEKIKIFTDHRRTVKSFIWSQKFRFIASAGEERHILLWDPFTCTKINVLQGHTSSVQSIALNEERNQLVSLGVDKLVLIWDLRSSRLLKVITDKTKYRPENILTNVIMDEIPERLVFTSKKLNFWPFKTKYESFETSHDFEVAFCFYNSQFDTVISIDYNSNVVVWDCKEGQMVFRFGTNPEVKITTAMLEDKERRIIIGNQEGRIEIYNFNNGQLLKEYVTDKKVELTCLGYTEQSEKDGQYRILAAGWEKLIYFFRDDPEVDKLEKKIPKSLLFESHKHDILTMGYSRKHHVIATGDADGIIILWDSTMSQFKRYVTEQDKSCNDKSNQDRSVEQILMIDSKDIFMSFTCDQIIRVWNTQNGALLFKVLANHHKEHIVTKAAMCRDEEIVATFDSGGYFKLWDITELRANNKNKRDLQENIFIRAHKSEITCGTFVHMLDQKFLVTGSLDKNLNMFTMEGVNIGIFGRATWNLKNPDSFRKTAPRYGTPKTPREIEQYVEYESPSKLRDQPRDRRVTINLNREGSSAKENSGKKARVSQIDKSPEKQQVLEEIKEQSEKEKTKEEEKVDVDKLLKEQKERRRIMELEQENERKRIEYIRRGIQYKHLDIYGAKHLNTEKNSPQKLPKDYKRVVDHMLFTPSHLNKFQFETAKK